MNQQWKSFEFDRFHNQFLGHNSGATARLTASASTFGRRPNPARCSIYRMPTVWPPRWTSAALPLLPMPFVPPVFVINKLSQDSGLESAGT
jgi:hypothetical protein